MSPEERLVKLETQMANVLQDFHEMKTDIRAIRDTLQEARGGWRALMFVGRRGGIGRGGRQIPAAGLPVTYDRIAMTRELSRDEGRIPYVYKDHLGYDTIGIGFLVDKAKGGRCPDAVIDYWLSYILDEREKELDRLIPWWRQLTDARQRAIMNMAYQLGTGGLMGFPAMLGALQAGRYQEAADEAMDSKWARQTPERAARVSEMIRKG